MREKIATVTIHDCEVQTFRSGGNGGQNQNKRDTGVRVIHHPSGARGESREHRTQPLNKRAAFLRMANSPKFKYWADQVVRGIKETPEERVAKDMLPSNLTVECRKDGKWVPFID